MIIFSIIDPIKKSAQNHLSLLSEDNFASSSVITVYCLLLSLLSSTATYCQLLALLSSTVTFFYCLVWVHFGYIFQRVVHLFNNVFYVYVVVPRKHLFRVFLVILNASEKLENHEEVFPLYCQFCVDHEHMTALNLSLTSPFSKAFGLSFHISFHYHVHSILLPVGYKHVQKVSSAFLFIYYTREKCDSKRVPTKIRSKLFTGRIIRRAKSDNDGTEIKHEFSRYATTGTAVYNILTLWTLS